MRINMSQFLILVYPFEVIKNKKIKNKSDYTSFAKRLLQKLK
jgi:hypothetical protein